MGKVYRKVRPLIVFIGSVAPQKLCERALLLCGFNCADALYTNSLVTDLLT